MGVFEHLPYTNFHNLNLDWVIEQVNNMGLRIDNIDMVLRTLDEYEKKEHLTNNRKLSETGDFTGTIFGRPGNLLLGQVDSNTEKIRFLVNMFNNGQTGLVIDGGVFTEMGINKLYDGGKFRPNV